MPLTLELKTKIEELLKIAEQGTLVRSMESVYRLLEENHLMSEQRISARFMGVHPWNRDGSGVSSGHVAELLGDLVELGWSDSEFRGMAVELSQKDMPEVRSYNAKIIAESGGRLAEFDDLESLKFATIAGSHTTQAMRLFLAGMPHPLDTVTEQGRLSLAKLRQKDPDFHDVCLNGATYKVVSRIVPETFPQFCRLAQSAANASGHVAREETELQVCRKMIRCIEELRRQRGPLAEITLQDIKQQVLKSKPRCAAAVPALFVFTLRYGGGASAHLLHQTEAWVRAHGFANRALGIEIYEGLSVDVKGADQKVMIRHMALQFAHGLSDEKPLTVSDIKRLLSNGVASKVEKAQKLATQAKDFLVSNRVADHIVLEAVGFLHVDLISLILDKKFKKYDSMEAAVEACVTLANKRSGLSLISPVSMPEVSSGSSLQKSQSLSPAASGAEASRGILLIMVAIYIYIINI